VNKQIKNCAASLRQRNYNSFLVSNPINIAYLTGFREDAGYLLITAEEELYFFTNFLYKEAAKKIKGVKLCVNDISGSLFTLIGGQIKALKHKRIGFEAKNLPFLEYKTLQKELSQADIELLQTIDFIEKMRMVKTANELLLMKKSVQISKEAFEFVSEIFDQRMSEKDLSIEVERFLRIRGDNEIAFESIVAAGKNTVFPHHRPGNQKIGKEFFLIDLGSKYYGYCADLTRMFFEGKIPPLFRKIYDTIRKARDASIKKIREGITAEEIDKAARSVIDKKGWGRYFGHGVGHGIGLSVHEPPLLRPGNDTILKEGMVVTIEPAVYLDDKFGVRIEEMVLVKKQKAEVLSGNLHW
jgi:Xaa-Pro aminopeptidase